MDDTPLRAVWAFAGLLLLVAGGALLGGWGGALIGLGLWLMHAAGPAP